MWFFRLPPLVHLVLAPLGLVLAVYLFISDQQSEAAKTAARSAKPPAAVAIEKFDPARDQGGAEEAVILGQVDLGQSYELSKTKSGVEREHYVLAPIYPLDAKDTSAPAPGVLMQKGQLSDDQLRRMAVGNGPIGPIMKLDGKILSAGDVGSDASQFQDRVRTAANAIYIDPFEEGRGEGLKPDSTGRNVAIGVLVVSLILGAFGLFRFLGARKAQAAAAEGYM